MITDSRPKERRHRPYEPRTRAHTDKAKSIAEQAFQDQFNHRSDRSDSPIRKAKNESLTVEALICDVIAHYITDYPERDLTIRLSNKSLNGGASTPTLNRGIPQRLDDLDATNWLKVARGNNHGAGQLTTLRPGPRLLEGIHSLGVSIEDVTRERIAGDYIEMRGPKSNDNSGDADTREIVRLEATCETRSLRDQVRVLNQCFIEADIEWQCSEIRPLDISRRQVQRYFLDGRLDHGGRLKGPAFWLDAEKHRRRSGLRLQGSPVAELDLKSAMPSIAYAKRGLELPHDPYVPPDLHALPRDILKIAFSTFLWKPYKPTGRFTQEVYDGILAAGVKTNYTKVWESLRAHNGPISEDIGAADPVGPKYMRHESNVIISATLACYDAGIHVLPLHDALLLPHTMLSKVTEIFSDAFQRELGVPPVIVQEWPEVTHE